MHEAPGHATARLRQHVNTPRRWAARRRPLASPQTCGRRLDKIAALEQRPSASRQRDRTRPDRDRDARPVHGFGRPEGRDGRGNSAEARGAPGGACRRHPVCSFEQGVVRHRSDHQRQRRQDRRLDTPNSRPTRRTTMTDLISRATLVTGPPGIGRATTRALARRRPRHRSLRQFRRGCDSWSRYSRSRWAGRRRRRRFSIRWRGGRAESASSSANSTFSCQRCLGPPPSKRRPSRISICRSRSMSARHLPVQQLLPMRDGSSIDDRHWRRGPPSGVIFPRHQGRDQRW